LAEHKVSYSRIWLWLHRAALFDYTTYLTVGERRAYRVLDRLLCATNAPLGSTKFSTPRPVHRPGSLAVAKRRPSCIGSDRIRERRSELRSNSRALPRDLGTRAACSTTIASGVSPRLQSWLCRPKARNVYLLQPRAVQLDGSPGASRERQTQEKSGSAIARDDSGWRKSKKLEAELLALYTWQAPSVVRPPLGNLCYPLLVQCTARREQ
jgi:hypothetical protein